MANALRFIRDQAKDKLTANAAAAHVDISRRELKRARITKVSSLLLQTDLTLEQISNPLGFSEVSNMASLFKKQTGHSPRKFR